MAKELIFIKIGGGSITDDSKSNTARKDVITRLLAEIYAAKNENDFDVIIGHGGGSFGHHTAKEYRTNEGFVNERSKKGAALTAKVSRELNNIVTEIGAELDIPVFPFSPSSFALAENKRLVDGTIEPIRQALDKGFIPIVYGDAVIDSKMGVCIASTEEILRFIAIRLKPTKVVVGADVDGVYDKDPSKFPDAKLVRLVTPENIDEVIAGAGGAKKIDVTGGMKTKIGLVYEIVKATGADGYIANVKKDGVLRDVLLGKDVPCTVIKSK